MNPEESDELESLELLAYMKALECMCVPGQSPLDALWADISQKAEAGLPFEPFDDEV